jgi:2-dehydro-3-deoxyphosphogluconate aldolase / (4S)-4-hydroxy-2-oxoglutarate aldolase
VTDLDELLALRVIFVIRASSAEAAVAMADGVIAGGGECIEITMTVPESLSALARVRERHSAVTVGMGTVRSPSEATEAVVAGAQFLVAPGLDCATWRAAARINTPLIPGVLSPSEVLAARRLGMRTVKLFPAAGAGPEYLRALRGPFPDVDFVPSGGVRAQNVVAWFEAGAVAVGVGIGGPDAATATSETERLIAALP